MKTKQELLEHYSEREPVEFIQYDVFTNPATFDDVVTPDSDGYSTFCSRTEELMTGIYTLRLLVTPETKKEKVIGGLKKIIEWIEKQPELLKSDSWEKEGQLKQIIGSKEKKRETKNKDEQLLDMLKKEKRGNELIEDISLPRSRRRI